MPIALGDRIIADFVLMLLNTFLYLPSLLKWCVLALIIMGKKMRFPGRKLKLEQPSSTQLNLQS